MPYASDNAGCEEFESDPDCVSYSEQDMCNRLDNDHNYFAVCRDLFSKSDNFGLLNGLPNEILESFPDIPKLQKQCYESTVPGKRESAAKQLISLYTKILSSF